MTQVLNYDVAIIGGGLAGLALSIQLADAGHSVVLFEKEFYPFHKVCGEYISLESWNFIESLGLPISDMQLPMIKKLVVSSPDGNMLTQELPLGGFGISRYKLDDALQKIALSKGVALFENCKVEAATFTRDHFEIKTVAGSFSSTICCGCFGKRSNIDVQLKRNFIAKKNAGLNNYIGVKYHIRTSFPHDTIALHNFENGYCGISKIEEDRYCLCYLTTAANLKASNNSITEMEKNVVGKNMFLQKIFAESEILYKSPLTISQVSFSKKNQVEDHLLMLGDAAGMISPLCGNGMSMALHSSKIAASLVNAFLQHTITRAELEKSYELKWQQTFGSRLRVGRMIQQLFGKSWTTNIFIALMKRSPLLTSWLIRHTHGKPF